MDLDHVARGMTASPIISPKRGQYILQFRKKDQTLSPDMFPKLQTGHGTRAKEKESSHTKRSNDMRTSVNTHGGISVNASKMQQVKETMEIND